MEEKYILAEWMNNDLPKEELDKLKEDSDYSIYNNIREHAATLKTKDFDEDSLLHKIKLRKNETGKVIQMAQNWFFRVVALILISLGVFMVYQENTNVVEFAKKGTKSAFLLPDQSEITLNSDSELKYKNKNWDNNRILHLTGEAYFKVAKGKTFEVNTTLGKVTVLGTQFNVKARNKRFDVVCFEGRVQVNHIETTIILTQGEKVSFENNDLIIQKKTNETAPSWLENELLFEQEQLKNIIEEIERQYNISIGYDPKSANQLFTGKIPTNNISVALEIIATTYQLQPIKISDLQYELIKMNEI
ncbi:MAG: iron dicitrate transport regulator FecR [Flavobacterium sp.]|uniref:FecR family protein n=1 Tax=Flavobacterium sp. TaxID=239 RepID=UPI000C66962A|nr:FecR family protein [Flavobacterium sp.]MBF04176.1 iron dicitrate transport regulator FecR [Flavobacterium sp.]